MRRPRPPATVNVRAWELTEGTRLPDERRVIALDRDAAAGTVDIVTDELARDAARRRSRTGHADSDKGSRVERSSGVVASAREIEEVSALDSTAPDSEPVYRLQVGRRVRLQRVGLGLSQQEVADAAGLTRNFVSAMERGRQGLDAWRLGQLAAGLSTSLNWLLGIKSD